MGHAEAGRVDTIWPYKRWAVKALAAMGKKSEAIRYTESCRGPWTHDGEVDTTCEEILLSSGLVGEAYEHYGPLASRGGTYLATFRAVAKKYPHKSAGEVLADLVKTTPGDEGKWFAAAKEAGLYGEALALASWTPCDPKTLARAARDFAAKQPAFAVSAGLLALHWLVQGYGYEITGADLRDAATAPGGRAAAFNPYRVQWRSDHPAGSVRGSIATSSCRPAIPSACGGRKPSSATGCGRVAGPRPAAPPPRRGAGLAPAGGLSGLPGGRQPGNRNRQEGPDARLRRRSSVASGRPKASATATYQPS